MSRESRRLKAEQTLERLEAEFRDCFIAALHRCAEGRWGLFGQNDLAYEKLGSIMRERLASRDAASLIELGDEIEELREQLGLPRYALHERYLAERRKRGPNVPGEPRLAEACLAEFERGEL